MITEMISEARTALPYEGEWSLASNRKFEETIVFVHHFGGSKRTLLRHSRLMNELGFNCVRFNLTFNKTEDPQNMSLTGDFKVGLRRAWADELQDILNRVSGPKIIFTFSMPGTAAVEAISDRNAFQISGLVCDSGPFLNITKATWRLYERLYKIENKFLRGIYTAFSFSMWGLNFKAEIKNYFKNFPNGFRILSIRGSSDHLVPAESIDEFFALATNCEVEKLTIHDADHLQGLKKNSAEYIPAVKKFLEKISQPVATDPSGETDR